ncbi:Diphthamide biosynthesis protein 3 [Tilletia horrida]|uniref:Diphthamide biosynthesis protein 3 n=1 Tax=Tilletia horrida TaxID=155126 RepID=A0AAN6JSQ5_9BASI|nr:Diphthamide biosynthesis protein 3 [Tilletia horrida]KAK0567791.1 Diphthamide biosynthesis protein 3 [Tilletia horrida]
MPAQSIYDEIELEDMSYDAVKRVFHYPCPCGDRFEISRAQLREAEDIARCPSCSLLIRVVYDPLDFEDDVDEEDEPEKATISTQPVAIAA